MTNLAQKFLRALGNAVRQEARRQARPTKPPKTKPRTAPSRTSPKQQSQKAGDGYPGDFTGVATITYQPHPDDRADPGEIVWTWVPYEDRPAEGKDRPVLLIGWDEGWLLGLMLTSKDHDRDAADEARYGRYWMDLGTGDWDSRRRPSEVRLDRIIRIRPDSMRREGAVLDRKRFNAVARAVKETKGW